MSDKRRGATVKRVRKMMSCLRSREQLGATDGDKTFPSAGSYPTKEFSANGYSAQADNNYLKPDTGNIEEAESSLRESGALNYEEARALLGRYEYQKGNIEAALHVFEGINISAVIPKMKLALARKPERRKKRVQNKAPLPMSIHAACLLLEAVLLKAKSLQGLGKFKEAAQSCKVILDIVESSLPDGLPENFGADCKLQETLTKAVELLPELWILAESPREAILSYRRALLHRWNLDPESTARIQKEFAILLLYSGDEASPPNLRSQMDTSFVPRNNIEEAILLLMILLRNACLRRIDWDPSILDHLSFALSVSGDLMTLANQIKGLLPGTLDPRELHHTLGFCCYGAGDSLAALNLLRVLLRKTEDCSRYYPDLLLASKICGGDPSLAAEGVDFARRAIQCSPGRCDQMLSIARFLLGISLSVNAGLAGSASARLATQSEALQALEAAGRMTGLAESAIVHHLCLENAEQRRLDASLYYAKKVLELEAGSDVKGWLLLARVLSGQKRFGDAEVVINAALDQTVKWDHGQLLKTKAKLQIAQGQAKNAIETYTQLLAIVQVQSKSTGSPRRLAKGWGSKNPDRSLELETWHDLARLYINLYQWRDAEFCLSKSEAINPFNASRYHVTGLLYEAKDLPKEALSSFMAALEVESTHVPSLISAAVVLRRLSGESFAVARSFLTEALRLDRTNHRAWHCLGLLYRAGGSAGEAAECFEAAALLEETAPIEPFG